MNNVYQEAIKYYIEHQEISIKETAKKFNIDRLNLGKKLTDLELNDSKDRQRKYHFNENFFEDIQTSEQAYYLEWLHSDGNVNDHQVRLRISQKDEEVLQRFNSYLQGNLPIKIENSDNRKPISNLTICSGKMVEDLSQYGIVEDKTFKI